MSRRRPILSEKANPQSIPASHSPLENTPHKAGVERDGFMATSGATIQVATECCRTAKLDGIEYAEMEPRQPGSVLCDEAIAVLSDDVGHLERWPVHCFCFFRERLMLSGLETEIVSKGLVMAVKCFFERCRYTAVCSSLAWPSNI